MSVKTALPLVTVMVCKAFQAVRLVEPRTVACAAPGAVRLNCTRPSERWVTDLALIVGASTMLKVASLVSNTAALVALRILTE